MQQEAKATGDSKILLWGFGAIMAVLVIILGLVWLSRQSPSSAASTGKLTTVVCGPYVAPERVYGRIADFTPSGNATILRYNDGYLLRVEGPMGGYTDRLGLLVLQGGRATGWATVNEPDPNFNPCKLDIGSNPNAAPPPIPLPTQKPAPVAPLEQPKLSDPPAPVILPSPEPMP